MSHLCKVLRFILLHAPEEVLPGLLFAGEVADAGGEAPSATVSGCAGSVAAARAYSQALQTIPTLNLKKATPFHFFIY